MKLFVTFLLAQVLIVGAFAKPDVLSTSSGFYIPDSVSEVTMEYKSFRHLILLPVTINDTIHVNVILDTGCRSLILFGKRFKKFFFTEPNAQAKFSGFGSGGPVVGGIALKNKVTIGSVLGDDIPIVVVPNKNLFHRYPNVHGVVGYEIFSRFEIEINPRLRTIIFRPAMQAQLPDGYTHVPMCVEKMLPLIDSEVMLPSRQSRSCYLMIDTRFSLGLASKNTIAH